MRPISRSARRMLLKLNDGVTLYFSRHGETRANIEKRFSGARDTPLTDKGRMQAADIGETLLETLGEKPQIGFVCSPLQRARTTMEIIRGKLRLPESGYALDPRIQEINLGAWDQLTNEEARALDPAAFDKRMADKWNVRVPGGGENYADVAARAQSWIGS